MTLGQLINALKNINPDVRVEHGFGEPHSWRGSYFELSFEPVQDTTIGEMLAYAEYALDRTFRGYKGGEYVMHEHVDCHIDNYGECSGDLIGPTLVAYWRRGNE